MKLYLFYLSHFDRCDRTVLSPLRGEFCSLQSVGPAFEEFDSPTSSCDSPELILYLFLENPLAASCIIPLIPVALNHSSLAYLSNIVITWYIHSNPRYN